MNSFALRVIMFAAALACITVPATAASPGTTKTQNIIFVMTDGLRWQEVFGGAESVIMTKENGGVTNPDALKKAYWRETAEDRRRILMPLPVEILHDKMRYTV